MEMPPPFPRGGCAPPRSATDISSRTFLTLTSRSQISRHPQDRPARVSRYPPIAGVNPTSGHQSARAPPPPLPQARPGSCTPELRPAAPRAVTQKVNNSSLCGWKRHRNSHAHFCLVIFQREDAPTCSKTDAENQIKTPFWWSETARVRRNSSKKIIN